MILYFTPGACSQASHIALIEAGLPVETVKVDLRQHRTEGGDDFYAVNPKGYVPVLVLDDGTQMTENVAIIAWVAEQAPHLVPDVPLGRIRLIEQIGFMSSELHKPFLGHLFMPTDEAKAASRAACERRLATIAAQMEGDYAVGSRFSAADIYLYLMSSWAIASRFAIDPKLVAHRDRIAARPSVVAALKAEGLA
jgi:glutathione S-transferase